MSAVNAFAITSADHRFISGPTRTLRKVLMFANQTASGVGRPFSFIYFHQITIECLILFFTFIISSMNGSVAVEHDEQESAKFIFASPRHSC